MYFVVVKFFISQEADLIMAPITINSQREEVMDFTTQFYAMNQKIELKIADPMRPVIINYDILKLYLSLIISALPVLDIIWQPKSSAGKIYMSFLWLTFLVVAATYTANLVATLSTQKPKVPYKTLDEVAEDDKFTLLIWPHSIQRIVLEVHILHILSNTIDLIKSNQMLYMLEIQKH